MNVTIQKTTDDGKKKLTKDEIESAATNTMSRLRFLAYDDEQLLEKVLFLDRPESDNASSTTEDQFEGDEFIAKKQFRSEKY